MLIKTFKQLGNGQDWGVDLAMRPKGALAAVDAAQPAVMWSPEIWANRTSPIGATDSRWDALRPYETGLFAGQDASVNTSGATTHCLAWGASKTVDYETGNYMGNLQAGRVVYLQTQQTPIAVLVKRDSTRAPVLWANGQCLKLDGTGASTAITSVGVGRFVVDASNESNEYNAAGQLGEGIEYWAFFSGGSVSVATWAGGQAAGAQIASAFSAIRGAIIVDTAAASAVVTLVDTMPAGYGKQGSTALAANVATISGNKLLAGSGNAANQAGRNYVALIFSDAEALEAKAPALITKKKRAVYLPGRDVASYIDCGVSDATLKINGAISIEWYGVPFCPQGAGGADGAMITRGAGSWGAAGSASWGVEIFLTPMTSLHWQSAMLGIVTADRWGTSGSLEQCQWRTGTLGPLNSPVHWMITHNGIGLWKIYKNGKLVNQRNIDLTNTAISQGAGALPNIQSGAGHKTLIGARMGGAATAYLRALFMLARVYSRELSAEESVARFQIAALGASKSGDITSGLAEEWDAANAGGNLVPATVNSANNGTINYGSVITL